MSERTQLIPRSCDFVAPEEIVTTVEVKHPAPRGRRASGRASPNATIVKGCPSRYALETCDTLQMGTLSYYRKKGDSLIWDLLEGVIAGEERVESRQDDPVRRDKAPFLSGCESRPATVAPAGSSRSGRWR